MFSDCFIVVGVTYLPDFDVNVTDLTQRKEVVK